MKIFNPCRIGSMEIRNRIVMAPMSCNLCEDGFVTDRMVRFFEERARGGVGLIVIGDGIVDSPIGNNVKESTVIDNDRYIPALAKLTHAVKSHGTRIALQLSHAGRRAGRVAKGGYLDVTHGKIPVAPSSLPHPVSGYVVPRELTQEEIEGIIRKFGDAATRAIEAGFDAVGIHCAHMYLCGQFLSPWANRRTDGYGGDFEGRLRFVSEVIGCVRGRIGQTIPLIVRMNGEEPAGGNNLLDIRKIARRFEDLGVDAISVSVGFGAPVKTSGFIPSVAPMRAVDGCIVRLAENIKHGLSIPVMVSNKIGDLGQAERILQEGKADLIALGRPLIADPYLPSKGERGDFEEIVPCIYCGQGCIQNVLEYDKAVTCTVNPAAAREGEVRVSPAARKKNVVVVGGGPGGLMAAKVLSERGHRVALYERDRQLGGQMKLASLPPGKKDIKKLERYLVESVRKAGVEIHLGEEFDSGVVTGVEVMIFAGGGKPVIPRIPGIGKKHVVTARDVLIEKAEVRNPVVVLGGGQVGAEVAEFLAEERKTVTIVEILEEVARGMPSIARLPLLCRLEELGVEMLTKAKVMEIGDESVTVEYKGSSKVVTANTVVIAVGSESDSEGFEKFKDGIPEIYRIGDSVKPRSFLDAIAEGFEIGLKI